MAKNKQKDFLFISFIIFVVVAISALLIVLNKGHIGKVSLVNINEEKSEEKLTQTIEVSTEKKYLSLKDKEEENIIVKVDGEVVTEGVEYASSNEDVIKIKDGKAVAVGNGKATITVMVGEIADSTDIRVITPIKTMKFTAPSSSIKVGNDSQMKLQVTPSNASIETLKYTSSDEEIATVNNNGIVTGKSKGKVTITVTDSYTGEEKSVNITIK